jgi:hypothetical protein
MTIVGDPPSFCSAYIFQHPLHRVHGHSHNHSEYPAPTPGSNKEPTGQ